LASDTGGGGAIVADALTVGPAEGSLFVVAPIGRSAIVAAAPKTTATAPKRSTPFLADGGETAATGAGVGTTTSSPARSLLAGSGVARKLG